MSSTTARGVILSTYLDPDEANLLRANARSADRSVAAEIRRLVRDYLQNDERRPHQSAAVQGPVERDRHAAG